MKPKIYSLITISEAVDKLKTAPPLPPTHATHEQALAELTSLIRDLHLKRHYGVKSITNMLRESGVKATQKEIKNILGLQQKKAAKKTV